MKYLFSIVIAILIHTVTFGQQWLHFSTIASSDWINLNDLDVSGNAITLEALVSARDTSQLNGLNIISKHTDFNDVNYILRPNRFEITTSVGYTVAESPVRLCPDSVYHLSGTYDGDSARFYVNGVVVTSVAHSGTLITNNQLAAIGNRSSLSNEQFKGYIDEVRIWNVARSQPELSTNMYTLANPTTQLGLIAYYQFEGNYTNIQGNTSWNGGVIGSQSTLSTNPFFNGSISSSVCSTILSITENSNNSDVQIIPNPAAGEFFIAFDGANNITMNLKIVDSIGRTVLETNNLQSGIRILLDVPNGIYFAILSSALHFQTERICIHK